MMNPTDARTILKALLTREGIKFREIKRDELLTSCCCNAAIGDGEHYSHGRCAKCGEPQS